MKNFSKNLYLQIIILITLLFGLVFTIDVSAQYFGRNKVKYDDFDFKILHTEHFDVYFYPKESRAVEDAAVMIERWNERLSSAFHYQFPKKQPLILYANHADFQQTNVISGLISQGTGGVTEGLQNRIVIPLTGVYGQNDHVLGHELVHGFQYSFARAQNNGLRSLVQQPLWFIEGMAEYFSTGREDPNTAMWMRDAVLHEDIPTIDDMTRNPKYFPYRYGQAFWAYVTGKWGDDILRPLFNSIFATSLDSAFVRVLGINSDSLSKEWKKELQQTFSPEIENRTKLENVGQLLLAESIDAGQKNLAPSISPDGGYVAFLSERDLFTIDLFLADAHSGNVIRKLGSSSTDSHFDALRFMNSAGAWSPNGEQFAFVVFSEGDNSIVTFDINSGDVRRKIHFKNIGAIYHLAWSPDGERLLFSGSQGGISNLYLYGLQDKTIRQLTDDRFADMQPTWSPDSQKIAFVTDRGAETNLEQLRFDAMQIALLDIKSGNIEILDLFDKGKHINPQFSPDGRALFFVADPDGFSDIYRFDLSSGEIDRITKIATGISGLTELSPCLSVAAKNGRMVFSVFEKSNHNVYALSKEEISNRLKPITEKPFISQGILPPPEAMSSSMVHQYLNEYEPVMGADSAFQISDYSASLMLKYVGQPSIGIGVDQFGSYLGGGVTLGFGDMLNNHLLSVTAQINGTFKDIGGQVAYLNREQRYNWGAVISHIPYRVEQSFVGLDTVSINGSQFLARSVNFQRVRIFDDRIMLLGHYPLSTNRRLEADVGYNRISYDAELEEITTTFDGQVIDRSTRDLPAPEGLNLFQSSLAYVGDYSFFGFTSPVKGKRYRVEVEPTFGSLQYYSISADYRHYFFMNPLTLALRGVFFGRFGKDAESERLSPLYVGYETLIRGYSSFSASECSAGSNPNNCPEFDRLLGSRMAVFNAEIRVPLFGTPRFGLFNFPYLPTELSVFLDGAMAWTSEEAPVFKLAEKSDERIPVFSTGVAARVSLLGALVTQFYYAIPFQRPRTDGKFGFLFSVGW